MAVTSTGYAVKNLEELRQISDLPEREEQGYYKLFVFSEGREYMYIPTGYGEVSNTIRQQCPNVVALRNDTISFSGVRVIPYIKQQKVKPGYWLPCYPQMLQKDLTLYVSPVGNNDFGDGLTELTAFATVQRALMELKRYYINGFNVTVQMLDGYYVNSTPIFLPLLDNCGLCVLKGNTSNRAKTVITNTSTAIITSQAQLGGSNVWTVRDLTLLGLASGFSPAIYVTSGVMNIRDLTLDNVNYAVYVYQGGIVNIVGNLTFTGSMIFAMYAWKGLINCVGRTITNTSVAATTGWLGADANSMIYINGCTFSGSATGTRYRVGRSSTIFTAGGGANYLPGNSGGVISTFGNYL